MITLGTMYANYESAMYANYGNTIVLSNIKDK